MRLILHAGAHKTGTTSIQAALAANRDRLSNLGYAFPPLCGSEKSHNHFSRRLALAASDSEVSELKEAVLKFAQQHEATILSGEEMSARIVGTRNWIGYDSPTYWTRRSEFLQRLREITRAFDSTTIFICFRRADEFAESLYATMILSGRFSGAFEQFLSAAAPIFNYGRQFEAFGSVFDDIRIIPFDALSGNLIPAFCRWTGIPELPHAAERKKVTPDLRLIDWVARTTPSNTAAEDDGRLRAEFARSGAARRIYEGHPKATLWPNPEVRQRFAERSAAELPREFFPRSTAEERIHRPFNEGEYARISQAFNAWRTSMDSRKDRPSLWRRLAAGVGAS